MRRRNVTRHAQHLLDPLCESNHHTCETTSNVLQPLQSLLAILPQTLPKGHNMTNRPAPHSSATPSSAAQTCRQTPSPNSTPGSPTRCSRPPCPKPSICPRPRCRAAACPAASFTSRNLTRAASSSTRISARRASLGTSPPTRTRVSASGGSPSRGR
ncbi:uncharacterized protein PV07_00794 [Cladophialophora immunda]|uniref:Uncharacterized protein n=1 Tax=Cladophialophora immunda TaxID=569365 RepID=A0A0D2CS41_9EURO|nr:uncharacterized protein PV07_00794 [Cladophialophora immunda]KIW33988.1 hypothetical protein PV07_00794 [Cladophialophora immunda]